MHSGDVCTVYMVAGQPVFAVVANPCRPAQELTFPTLYALWAVPELLLYFATSIHAARSSCQMTTWLSACRAELT
jgi:hypothetical protein